jgi:UDP-N-acetylglucosamine acyltransferase
MAVHSTAVISSKALIADDVEIGPFVVIGEGCRIGAGCVIGPHVVVHAYTMIGPQTRIHAGAVIGDWPQDVAFRGAPSETVIGARCMIREGVTIHRGTKEGTRTVVGDDCFLMANSHLAHNVVLGNNVIIANGALLAGYVEVGDRAFISGNVVIHQFCRIGRLAMLSGLSGIGKDVPPFCMTAGVSRNRIGGLNIVGLRRAGFSADERKQIKAAFDTLYRSGLNVSQAVERLKVDFPSGPAAEFWRFAEQSKRGLCAFRGEADAEE